MRPSPDRAALTCGRPLRGGRPSWMHRLSSHAWSWASSASDGAGGRRPIERSAGPVRSRQGKPAAPSPRPAPSPWGGPRTARSSARAALPDGAASAEGSTSYARSSSRRMSSGLSPAFGAGAPVQRFEMLRPCGHLGQFAALAGDVGGPLCLRQFACSSCRLCVVGALLRGLLPFAVAAVLLCRDLARDPRGVGERPRGAVGQFGEPGRGTGTRLGFLAEFAEHAADPRGVCPSGRRRARRVCAARSPQPASAAVRRARRARGSGRRRPSPVRPPGYARRAASVRPVRAASTTAASGPAASSPRNRRTAAMSSCQPGATCPGTVSVTSR